jgi:Uma2 family endonuclease
MAAVPKIRYTPEQYLALDRAATQKSQYYAGEIFAMAGGSPAHNAIAFNVAVALGPLLRGRGCRGYSSDMRIKVSESGLYTYADVVVVCGQPRFDNDHQDTLLNPTLIVEVLSPTTEAYDRGDKFAHYRRLESLQDYVLITQERCRIERYTRQPADQWLLAEARALTDAIHLPSLGANLALAAVYDQVELASEDVPIPGNPLSG